MLNLATTFVPYEMKFWGNAQVLSGRVKPKVMTMVLTYYTSYSDEEAKRAHTMSLTETELNEWSTDLKIQKKESVQNDLHY